MADGKRLFTRADAVAAGISPRKLGSRYRRIFRDVYIDACLPERPEHRLEAGLMLHPEGAWLSHTSAAKVYGISVPDDPNVHVSVVRAEDRRWCPGLKPHLAPVGTLTQVRNGLRVSSPARMFIELAGMLSPVDLIVAGDAICRVLGIKAGQLRAELAESRDYWSAAARYAAQFVRDGVDSPMETRLRMLLVFAGLPEPEVNLRIYNELGDVLVRFDLGYRAHKLAIEYDGRHHVDVRENWVADLERGDFTDDLGWRVVKVVARGVYVDPGSTIDRIVRALRARGAVLPRLSDEWRVHFPGRPRMA